MQTDVLCDVADLRGRVIRADEVGGVLHIIIGKVMTRLADALIRLIGGVNRRADELKKVPGTRVNVGGRQLSLIKHLSDDGIKLL